MNDTYHHVLSPVGHAGTDYRSATAHVRRRAARPVIGLLNNSKPNVALFLQALQDELHEHGASYEFVHVTKPRSAMPCPDLDALAGQCDHVINAVAD